MRRLLTLALILCLSGSLEAASRYWKGGGSSTNWDATGPTNWAGTSGGANDASVPGSSDDVFCDGNSGTGTSTLNTAFSVKSFDFLGCGAAVVANAALTVTGNGVVARFSSGMSYTGTSRSITFTGTAGTNLFTTAGQTPALVIQNGSGGTTQQQDDLISINATLTMDAGTWDTGADRTISVATLTTGGARTGTMRWNHSTLLLGANAGFTATAANLTIVPGTSRVVLTSSTAVAKTVTWTGQTLYDVEMTGAGTGTWTTVGSATVHDFVQSGSKPRALNIAAGTALIVTGRFSSFVPLLTLRSGTPTSTYAIAAALTNLRFVDVQDAVASGAASPFQDVGGINSGNTTGWAFPAHHVSLALQ